MTIRETERGKDRSWPHWSGGGAKKKREGRKGGSGSTGGSGAKGKTQREVSQWHQILRHKGEGEERQKEGQRGRDETWGNVHSPQFLVGLEGRSISLATSGGRSSSVSSVRGLRSNERITANARSTQRDVEMEKLLKMDGHRLRRWGVERDESTEGTCGAVNNQ